MAISLYHLFILTLFSLYPLLSSADLRLRQPVRVNLGHGIMADGVVTKIEGDQVTVHYRGHAGQFESVTVKAATLRKALNPIDALAHEEQRTQLDDEILNNRKNTSEVLRKKYGLSPSQTINPDGSGIAQGIVNNIKTEYRMYESYLKDLDQFKLSDKERQYWSEYYQALLSNLRSKDSERKPASSEKTH